jgi:hypothetical protein
LDPAPDWTPPHDNEVGPEAFQPGCQMDYFQTKNLTLGTFLEGLSVESIGTLMTTYYILRPFGKFYGNLV